MRFLRWWATLVPKADLVNGQTGSTKVEHDIKVFHRQGVSQKYTNRYTITGDIYVKAHTQRQGQSEY